MGSVKPENTAAPGVPFYTPAQVPPAGTPIEPTDATLFTPIKVRSVETENRFVVSPMCMYSAKDGHLTDFHLVHLGQFALRGAGMVMVEATAVEPQGRITPEDSGLWQDSQIEPLKRIVDYIHSQNTKAAIQIAHAGRKASTLAPWLTETTNKSIADESIGGWPEDVRGPSNIPFSDTYPQPHEITKDQIKEIVQKFADTAKRAVKAGFDVIEIHGAHGYLISSFLSPLANVCILHLSNLLKRVVKLTVEFRTELMTMAVALRTALVLPERSLLQFALPFLTQCPCGCVCLLRSGWNGTASPLGI